MSSDLRRCIRIAATDARNGQFVTADLQVPAQILNESARGFAILVAGDGEFLPDTEAALATESEWNRVRIVRVREVAGGQELGLERQIDEPPPRRTDNRKRGLWRRAPWLFSPQALAVAFGVFALAVLGGTVTFEIQESASAVPARWSDRYRGDSSARDLSAGRRHESPAPTLGDIGNGSSAGSGKRSGRNVPLRLSTKAANAVTSLSDAAGRNLPSPAAIAKLTALAPERLALWQDQLQALPWQSSQLLSMLSLELAHLNLSAQQQELIAGIIRRVVAEMQAIAARVGLDSDKASAARRLESNAVDEISTVFTPQQRERWQELGGSPTNNSSPN